MLVLFWKIGVVWFYLGCFFWLIYFDFIDKELGFVAGVLFICFDVVVVFDCYLKFWGMYGFEVNFDCGNFVVWGFYGIVICCFLGLGWFVLGIDFYVFGYIDLLAGVMEKLKVDFVGNLYFFLFYGVNEVFFFKV